MVSTEFGITQSIPTRAVHAWIQPDRINQHHTAWTAQQGCQQWMGAVVGGQCGFLMSPSTVIGRESSIPTILNQLTVYIDWFFLSISHIDFFSVTFPKSVISCSQICSVPSLSHWVTVVLQPTVRCTSFQVLNLDWDQQGKTWCRFDLLRILMSRSWVWVFRSNEGLICVFEIKTWRWV